VASRLRAHAASWPNGTDAELLEFLAQACVREPAPWLKRITAERDSSGDELAENTHANCPIDSVRAECNLADQQPPAVDAGYAGDPSPEYSTAVALKAVASDTLHEAQEPTPPPGAWMASQAGQHSLDIPEASVISAEAAAALETSSAAAADALHGILVQVAASRGEDTATFVQRALKDPAVMQVCMHARMHAARAHPHAAQSHVLRSSRRKNAAPWLQEALLAAQQSALAQQMQQLESYAATTEQLFGTPGHPHLITGADPDEATPVDIPPAPGDGAERHSHLRHVALAPGCSVPVPHAALEVARGVTAPGADGGPAVIVDDVEALRPFLKVRARRMHASVSRHCQRGPSS
jgi:hypothetical protein